MAHARSSDTQLTVMREAHRQGRDDIALMVLSGAVRCYIRSPKSNYGWQIKDWNKPFPEGTEGVVWLDTFAGNPKFYVTPVSEALKLVAAQKHDGRPVTRDSRHCYITPGQVADYADQWDSLTR